MIHTKKIKGGVGWISDSFGFGDGTHVLRRAVDRLTAERDKNAIDCSSTAVDELEKKLEAAELALKTHVNKVAAEKVAKEKAAEEKAAAARQRNSKDCGALKQAWIDCEDNETAAAAAAAAPPPLPPQSPALIHAQPSPQAIAEAAEAARKAAEAARKAEILAAMKRRQPPLQAPTSAVAKQEDARRLRRQAVADKHASRADAKLASHLPPIPEDAGDVIARRNATINQDDEEDDEEDNKDDEFLKQMAKRHAAFAAADAADAADAAKATGLGGGGKCCGGARKSKTRKSKTLKSKTLKSKKH